MYYSQEKFGRNVLVAVFFASLLLVACGDGESSVHRPDGKEATSSSSGKSSSSSIVYVEPCKTDKKDNCEYGTLTDERDGQTYKTVKIGNQWWMAENLNFAYLKGTMRLDSSSFCLNDSASNCEKYGRLYMWSAAMDSAALYSSDGKNCGSWFDKCDAFYHDNVRGACPEGWHLPTEDEWRTLITVVGGKSTAGKLLKSTSGWDDDGNGDDAYGFAVLPGSWLSYCFNFGLPGKNAYFVTSTQYLTPSGYVDNYVFDIVFDYDRDEVFINDHQRDFGYSIRCVQN